jgi:putative transposase
VAIEGYDVRNMMEQTPAKERKYARRNFKMADAAVGELRRQLEYKQQWAGGTVVIGGKHEPTNRRCSACGTVAPIVGLVEKWTCPNCGVEHFRRLNSAENVLQLTA